MLISIIVPVYNVEKYLRNCLDSILEQTYKELEVIMVDDGSKDASGEICEEYAARYDNFHVIHKENAGLGMARNTGLEYVSGAYVAFLDSDDYLEPDCIEILYKNLIANNAEMCKCGFRRVSNDGNLVSLIAYKNETFPNDDAASRLLPRMIGSAPDKHDSIEMSVCGVLYKTSIIKEQSIGFPSERELISEDMVFNIDYLQFARGACTVSYSGYNYRVNLNSLTKSYRPDRFEACKHFYIVIKEKLELLGYDRMTLLRLSRIFFVYLRMCISQETIKRQGISKSESIGNIHKICTDEVVRKIIDDYPQKKLEFKQSMFLSLVKWNQARILYLLLKR